VREADSNYVIRGILIRLGIMSKEWYHHERRAVSDRDAVGIMFWGAAIDDVDRQIARGILSPHYHVKRYAEMARSRLRERRAERKLLIGELEEEARVKRAAIGWESETSGSEREGSGYESDSSGSETLCGDSDHEDME